ncbi:MAG TPA: MFS transporter [Candidatus Poseidoniales archaeon]|nr:MAG TPA: MFS transporter [Candidatus Poseidoniales archaeon]|tara:strand:+ start:103 stop:1839 length:1737 start_codon:yes stop_codon:yes gene_type:complete
MGILSASVSVAKNEQERDALQGWYWYDWANQAFALTVLTVVVPALTASMYNTATGTQSGDSFYALVLGLSSLFVALVSPVLGAIADRIEIKRKILWAYTIVGVIFTAMMGLAPFLGEGTNYMFLAVCLVIGNIGFAGGNVIYYAFMPYLAEKEDVDHVSSWGYAYGFMGGSSLLIVHLGLGLTLGFTPTILAFIFVTSALWWLGWGYQLFLKTPEPKLPSPKEYESSMEAVKDGFREVANTFREIKKYKSLSIFLVSYLLFFDGVNTIGGMAAAYGESVLRLSTTMNFVLLLMVNIVAIPMTIIGGKAARRFGTKEVLTGALIVYCVVAILAVGFAPLDLNDDHERYDFQYDWDEADDAYELTTLYDRGVDAWVSDSGEGDAKFRDAFMEFLQDDSGDERSSLPIDEATVLASRMMGELDHRFSFSFNGGDLDGERSVGIIHPTMIGDGELSWWPETLRDNLWEPLGFGVNLQWIMLGTMVGIVMGTVGAQARSMMVMLTPRTKAAEFFGFFGFIGKAAAFIGPIIYSISANLYNSRVAVFTIMIVILAGTALLTRVDLEEGAATAAAIDREAWESSE